MHVHVLCMCMHVACRVHTGHVGERGCIVIPSLSQVASASHTIADLSTRSASAAGTEGFDLFISHATKDSSFQVLCPVEMAALSSVCLWLSPAAICRYSRPVYGYHRGAL